MFDQLIAFFESVSPVWAALFAGIFTGSLTAIGAALVIVLRDPITMLVAGMLGFAGGVFIAVSFWTLIAPAINMSPCEGVTKVLPSAIGFALGALFIFARD